MAAPGFDTAPLAVRNAITEAQRLTGVSLGFLASTAKRESGFNPGAKNPESSAAGLGQFTKDTWTAVTSRYGAKYGITPETSPYDARASAIMLGEYAKENGRYLKQALGRDASEGELYGAHFMGAGGFARLARAAAANPTASAASLFPKEAASNASIFAGKTVAEVYQNVTNGAQPGPVNPSRLPNIFEYQAPAPKKNIWADLGQGYLEAAKQEQLQVLMAKMAHDAGDPGLAPDPNFKVTPELVTQHTEGLDEKMATWVAENAHSERHMEELAKRAREEVQANEHLNEFGFMGNFGLRAAAILTDVPSWLITGGAAKIGMLGRAGWAARAASAGLIDMAAQSPLVAAKMQMNPGYDAKDALVDSLGAFAMGGLFGGAFGHSGHQLDAQFANEANAHIAAALKEQGFEFTPAGQAHYGAAEAATLPKRGAVSQMTSGSAAGFQDGPLKPGILDAVETTPNARLSFSHSVVRETAAKLDDKFSGDGGATVRSGETAFEEARRVHHASDATVSRVDNEAFSGWADAQGIAGPFRAAHKEDFEEAVGREIISPGTSASEHVAKAAQAFRDGFEQFLGRAKAAGAEWAQNVQFNPRYLPMYFDREKVRAALDKFGEEGVVSVVRQAMLKARPDMEAALVQKVAEKYVRTVNNVVEGLQGHRANSLSGLDTEGLKELLVQEGLDPAEADAFLAANRNVKKLGPGEFRHKTILDDTAKFIPEGKVRDRIEGVDGTFATVSRAATEKDGLSIRDLTNMKADEVWHDYSRSMSGYTAMVRAGFQTKGAWERHIREITLGQANKLPGYTDAMAARDLKDLEYLGKTIYGIPVRDMNSGFEKWNSLFGNINFSRVMGQSGIAQLGDMPKIMLHTSMAASLKTFDWQDMFDVFRRGGSEASLLTKQLETMTGAGSAGVRNDIVTMFKDMDHYYPDSKSEAFLDRAIRVSKTLANVTSVVSLMTPMNDFLQRWAVRAHAQHLADIVNGTAKADQKVLNDLGLGADELARFKNLFDHVEFAPNGTIKDMKPDVLRQVDYEGNEMLAAYLGRWSRRTVLEPTAGNLPRWMGESSFRFLGQFRSFSFASHSANTLHNIKMGHAYAAQSLFVTGTWATAVYALHTYTKSIGRADQAEYLEKNLGSPERLIASGLNRSSDSGILPSVIDGLGQLTVYPATGMESPFSNARTTGLEASFITGSPMVSLITDVGKTMAATAGALGGQKNFTATDANRAVRLVPLNNAYGIMNALRAFTDTFPKEGAK